MAPLTKTLTSVLPILAAHQEPVSFLSPLPEGYNSTLISHIDLHALAVIPGSFNRSIWSSPWNDTLSPTLSASEYQQVLSTPFIAYDAKFLDIIGPQPRIKKLLDLDERIHEAPSHIPDTNQLFFTAWGELKPDLFAQHNWQYWVDLGELGSDSDVKVHNITLNPPVQNAHGSFYHQGSLYIATDGGNNTSPSIHRVNVRDKTSKVVLNNYFGHPFNGFNDLCNCPVDGTIFATDSSTAHDHYINPNPPCNPNYIWMFTPSTGEVRAVGETLDKGNGATVSPDGRHLVVSDTGASGASGKDPFGKRSLTKYTIDYMEDGGKSIRGAETLASPIAGLYDGVRYTGNGRWLVGASYEGLDFLDAKTGAVLGTIKVRTPDSIVNFAFRKGGGVYVVGKGGVWEIKIAQDLAWEDSAFSDP